MLAIMLVLAVAAGVAFGVPNFRHRILTAMHSSTPTTTIAPTTTAPLTPEQRFANALSNKLSIVRATVTMSTLRNAGDQICNDLNTLTPIVSGSGYSAYQWLSEYLGGSSQYLSAQYFAVSGIPLLSTSGRQTFVGLAIEYICPQYRNQIPYGKPGAP